MLIERHQMERKRKREGERKGGEEYLGRTVPWKKMISGREREKEEGGWRQEVGERKH